MITLRPDAGVFEWARMLTLLSAGLYGAAQILARKLGESESAAVMTFYQNVAFLVGAPALAGAFAIIDPDISPSEPGLSCAALGVAQHG